MPYIPPEVVAKAKEMDLLTYLKNYEPGELVHFGGNTYCTRIHDSLKSPMARVLHIRLLPLNQYAYTCLPVSQNDRPAPACIHSLLGCNIAISGRPQE